MYFIDGYVGVMYVFWVFSKRKQTKKINKIKQEETQNSPIVAASLWGLALWVRKFVSMSLMMTQIHWVYMYR